MNNNVNIQSKKSDLDNKSEMSIMACSVIIALIAPLLVRPGSKLAHQLQEFNNYNSDVWKGIASAI